VALGSDRLTRLAIEPPGEETVAALRPAVERLLADPGPRAAAQAIADEMRALPPRRPGGTCARGDSPTLNPPQGV
jgi:hypothetical protein